MIDAPLALAFAAGMIATINPCGFALLPAYIGAFVAGDDTTIRSDRRIARAVGVSAAVSVGFAAMFIMVGVVFSSASSELRQQVPWVTIAVGLMMAAMGIARDSLVDAGTNLQTRFVVLTESVGAERIGLAIVATTAVAYLAFRVRHRDVATLGTSRPDSGPAMADTLADSAASRETTAKP